jgi:4'-phosphopantetheinyl transferase
MATRREIEISISGKWAPTLHEGSSELPNDIIHLWVLHVSGLDLKVCSGLLSTGELDRAARYRRNEDRDSFLASHGVLRFLAAAYVGVDQQDLQFAIGAHGKPRLEPASGVDFNLAHSGDLIALAFVRRRPLGIDIEQTRTYAQLSETACRFLCAEEAEEVASMDVGEQTRALVRTWTRKEAIVKATGEGLSMALDGFRVAVLPHEHPAVVHFGGDRNAAKEWILTDLPVPEGYAGSLAYCGQPCRVLSFSIADLPLLRKSIS